MSTPKKAKAQKRSWQYFAESYLGLAYVGIRELIDRRYCEKPNALWSISSSVYDGKLLLIPVLWNLKHGIELVIKALDVSLMSTYSQGHDLGVLSKKLETAFHNVGISDDKYINDFSNLTFKYYELQFLKEKGIIRAEIDDKNNDLLRYPEALDGYTLLYEGIQSVTEKEIDRLLEDIELLLRRLVVLDAKIQLDHDHAG